MKNMWRLLKKTIIRTMAGAAGIFLAVLGMVSCMNPLNPFKTSADDKASISVAIHSNEGRTLMPRFSNYSVSFSSEGKKSVILDNLDTPSAKAELEPGAWTVTARALVRINGIAYTAAESSAQVNLEPGQKESISLGLKMPQTGGKGTLYYNIGLPEGVTLSSAVLNLGPLEGGSSRRFDLSEKSEDSVEINSGVYLMSVTLKAGNLSAARTEVVHIYPRAETRVEGGVYRFSREDLEIGVYLAGTAPTGSAQGYSISRVEIFGDAGCIQLLATAQKFSGENNSWAALVNAGDYGGTVYIRPVFEKEDSVVYGKVSQFNPGPGGSSSLNLPSASLYMVTTAAEGPAGFGSVTLVSVDGSPLTGAAAAVIDGALVEFEVLASDETKYRVREGYPRLDPAEFPSGTAISLLPGDGPGRFRFTMPASDLTAAARFETIVDLAGFTLKSGVDGFVLYSPVPAFDPKTYSYEAGLVNTVTNIKTSGDSGEAAAVITGSALLPDLTTLTYLFDGDSWTSGSKPTSTAGNTVTIRVSANTAGDDASRDYRVTVKKTAAPEPPKVHLAGTAPTGNTRGYSISCVEIYSDTGRVQLLATVREFTGENNSWAGVVSKDLYNGTVYIRPALEKEGGVIYGRLSRFDPGPAGSNSLNLPPSSVYMVTRAVEGPAGFGSFTLASVDGSPPASPTVAAAVIDGALVELEALASDETKYRVREGYPRLDPAEFPSGTVISLLPGGGPGRFRFTMPESDLTAMVRFETIVDLEGITLKSGTGGSGIYNLTPAFDPKTTAYDAGLLVHSITGIKTSGDPDDATAVITGSPLAPDLIALTYLFDDVSWTSGAKTTSPAGNVVTIRVSASTAGDDASRDYRVTVKRAATPEVQLGGTAPEGNTQGYSISRVEIYGDDACTQLFATAQEFTGENNSWAASVSAGVYSGTVYVRPMLEKEDSVVYGKVSRFDPGPGGSNSLNLPSASLYMVTTAAEGPPGFGSVTLVSVGGKPLASPTTAAAVIDGALIEIEALASDETKYRVREGYPRLDPAEFPSGTAISLLPGGGPGRFRFTMPESDLTAAARFETIVDLAGFTLKSGNGGSVVYSPVPAFDPETTAYEAGVLSGVANIRNSGNPANNRAIITGNALLPDLTTVTYLFDDVSWPSGSNKTISATGNTVTIRVSAKTDGDDASRDYQVTVKRTTASGLPKITAFSFTQANNGDSLSAYTGDITGTLDQTGKTITITHNTSNVYRWIEGLNLKATFVADAGAKVYVKGVEQTSGASPVDFSGDVVYTAVSSDGFLRNDYTVLFQSPQLSGLPSVRVKTHDGKTINSREVYQKARIQIIDPANPAYNLDLPSDPYSYPDEIRGRGNTTWTDVGDYDYDKKNPYRIKFGSKKSLFGLTSAKSWVLLANKNDPTLIMNTVAFETARKIGLEFANHAIPVELYVNERYMGSYTLTEQVQVNPGRVDIDEDNGFLISMDTYNYNPPQYVDADPRFKAGANLQLPLMFKSPETDGLTGPLDLERDSTVPPHTTYQPFMAIMDSFVGALESTDSAVFPEQYRTYIDMDEFVDFIMINEMVRNTEVQHPKSFYFYRDAGTDAKIKMGPPWDFDWAFGGSGGNYFNETTKEGSVTIPRIMLYPNGKGPSPYNSVLPNSTGFKYFRRFFADPDFVARYKERWSTNKAKFGEIPAFIDGVSGNIAKSHAENVRRWGNNASGPTGTTFEAQMSNMKTWWNARVTYLNGQIAGW